MDAKRLFPWLSLLIVAFATARIVATYTVFSHTSDEPAHIVCGLEWIETGRYTIEPLHPPLTRVMEAIGPYLLGARLSHRGGMWEQGVDALFVGGRYTERLAWARAGNLPFFWIACWVLALWSRRILGPLGSLLSLTIFTMTPSVLAHASLATTDMGAVAGMLAMGYATLRFIEDPRRSTSLCLGLALAFLAVTKFSLFAYFPAALAIGLAGWFVFAKPKNLRLAVYAREIWPAAIVALLATWAVYRFSFAAPLPFPELFAGIQATASRNHEGNISYFLGQVSLGGQWLFFPVLTLVKLPLALLLLALLGAWKRGSPDVSDRRAWPLWTAVSCVVAIYAVGIPSKLNIGLRHVLPAMPFVAILAGSSALYLLRGTRSTQVAAYALLGWLCVESLAAHPDYIPYFNQLAAGHPETITADSDLDWGQDLKRLSARLHELNVPTVSYSPTVWTDTNALGFPPRTDSRFDRPAPGWNAVQIQTWKLLRMGLTLNAPGAPTWPDYYQPTERVGKTILLYNIPATTSK